MTKVITGEYLESLIDAEVERRVAIRMQVERQAARLRVARGVRRARQERLAEKYPATENVETR